MIELSRARLTYGICDKHGGAVPFHELIEVDAMHCCRGCAADIKDRHPALAASARPAA